MALARGSCLLLICMLNSIVCEEKPESCDGLDRIGASPSLSCSRSEDCLSTDCDVTESEEYGAILQLYPCDNPPAIEIFLKSPNDGVSSLGKFNSSVPTRTTAVPLSDEAEFEITVSWINIRTAAIMSEIVSGQIRQTLLESTTITLPQCTPATTRPATTCLALQQIAVESRQEIICKTNGGIDCDTLSCDTELHGVTVTIDYIVLPCNGTPALNIVAKFGEMLVTDKVLSKSEEFVVLTFTANVTLDQLDGAIGLQVDLIKSDGGVYEIIKYSEIPIDQTQCMGDSTAQPSKEAGMTPQGAIQHLLLLLLVSSLLHLLQ